MSGRSTLINTMFRCEEIVKTILVFSAVVVVVCSYEIKTFPNYFIHDIGADRWNKYVCSGCKYNYHPVCGSDWKTYGNACLLSCATQKLPGLHLLHRGECFTRKHKDRSLYASGCPQCRTFPRGLICGHNGITYYNVCYFDCFRKKYLMTLTIAHAGPCFVDSEDHLKKQGESETCICNRETMQGFFYKQDVIFRMKKLCGVITMYNPCQFDCELKDLGFKSREGLCDNTEIYRAKSLVNGEIINNPCNCPISNKTVCAAVPNTDGRPHLRSNSCFASCEGEQLVSKKKCLPRNCNCSRDYQPMCAMKLFRSVCHFECYKKTVLPGLTFHGVAACPIIPTAKG